MEKKPLTKRNFKAIKTKETLINASLQLINQYGYENVTVNDICKYCGVSKGSFYYHFKSKEDILTDREFKVNNTFNLSGLKDSKSDITEKLAAFLLAQIEALEQSGFGITRQRTIYIMGGEYISDIDEFSSPVYQRKILTAIIENEIKEGNLVDTVPVSDIIDLVIIFRTGIVAEWCMLGGTYSMLEKAKRLTHNYIEDILQRYRPNKQI
ncbi:MAG: TetR/AcrR family transcriptional regulator [Oscillospiraceae bacterium]|jgi:AcrR family transcriptional regulator